ncbi:MAG: guanylate kinase [Planctomycetes bacterium HGW-Planctomycetes-1]|nr:MAG: guanylate kinase [Planctomycetes bacterium HGW-Planctomycetes-1]
MSNPESNPVKQQVVVISGPSGVGKSTICGELIKRLDNVYLSISATTRPQKAGEQDGKDYYFIGRDEFEKQIKAGNFIEYAEVFGNLYGTPKDKLAQALEQGRIVLLEIDVQGARQVKKLYPEAKLIFIFPPKQTELQNRINGRGRDDGKDIEKRLAGAGIEIAAGWQHYEHIVINDSLAQAVEEVIQIIKRTGE